jgi:hypothetical protein
MQFDLPTRCTPYALILIHSDEAQSIAAHSLPKRLSLGLSLAFDRPDRGLSSVVTKSVFFSYDSHAMTEPLFL